ncbi:ATP-binding protein [Puia sp. P3]|uniref:ATP-binding protein n=1 Tax=Puia sp. P3 TaxID=3423952 RepID=UPI003D66D9B6
MATRKQTGLQRQDAFVKSMNDQNFDFGLVMTQAFLKGIRDIGYKSTATALFENIDNSIQADAENIHLIFDFDKGKSGKSHPDRIAIVDDGHGMSGEMLRIAVLWGGSDRLDDREGMGKYGYGLPSSCVSIGQRFTVISKRADADRWHSVVIDIEEIANKNPDYIDSTSGRIVAPEAKQAIVPDFVGKYVKAKAQSLKLEHGTIIIIEKIDRLSKSSLNPLKKFLSLETGITYRNFLRKTNIFIDGEAVQPVDPLFTTEGYRYYDENDLRAESLPSIDIKVPIKSEKDKSGIVKVRFSYMPYGFLGDKGGIDPEEQQKDSFDGEDSGEDENKRSKTKRLTIRKHNNGIIFLRRGRQIDVVDSKCPWTKFQNNDRYVGVEVDFTPELDEEFSITTSKQQIVASERIWNILRDNGVYEAIQQMRNRYKKQSEAANQAKENAIQSSPQKRDEFAENLMKESASYFELDKDSQPQNVKKEAAENFEKQVKKIAKETGMPEEAIKEQLEVQVETRPYKLDYFDELEGPFFRPEQMGGQVIIHINRSHRFYTSLYNNPQTNALTKNALALVVFVLGHCELRVTDENRKLYRIERNAWSVKLETTLETLSKHLMKSIDDDVAEEELTSKESSKRK